MHISIPMTNMMEKIEQTEISPLISRAKVKVCYVGQDPNRNGTVITKELATDMGKKLPGSPVVGYFNKAKQDFGGHDREIVIQGGSVEFVELTRPYGFVPTDASVWFQKFSDDGVEHEYLCTECYIWTGAYPESKRILDQGNNQSMELHVPSEKGFWANDDNSGDRIFIYNEALIEKLCVLGQDVEPCFEGAQVKSQFSLESSPEFQEFKTTMYSMLNQLLNKGGSQMENKENQVPEAEFEKKEQPEKEEDKKPTPPPAEEKPSEEKKSDEKPEEEKKPDGKNACAGNAEDKKKYNLEDVVEYTELNNKYTELQGQYSALQAEKAALEAEVSSLREFKANTDRKDKQAMIDSFFMLSDEDKKDCVEHIDTYSVDDIEAKLSIICVRNKVSFSLEQPEEKKEETPAGLFSLNNGEEDNAPDWIKAVRATANK